MSWIEKLYRTYEANASRIGDPNDPVPLVPICHTTQNAHVHVVIDGSGSFIRANAVPREEARTIIPATEESAGRTSGPVPHPLCDKLQYVAGDYADYGGSKHSLFDEYCTNLEAWSSSGSSHPKVQAVLAYVRKKRLIRDLVDAGVLHVNGEGALADRWSGDADSVPGIFKATQNAGGQTESFVRFSVEVPNEPEPAVWRDRTLWESWIRYYGKDRAGKALCYVTGEEQPLAKQHPKNIRRSGDAAKLISSNDCSGYTFRGRFCSADEACGVGFEVTQKAHSALRWLIGRQGRDGDQVVVAWAVSGADVPDLFADTFALLFGDSQGEERPAAVAYTAEEVGRRLSQRIAGYSAKLGDTTAVVVMALDSATPGRMAITFYRELTGSELLARVQSWHEGCCWYQRFDKRRVFLGAPSPRDIAETAYGTRLDEKLRKATIERLLPCIVDGAPIPRDLVESCVRRASNRQGIEPWEWEKALGVACALYRYYNKERSYAVALERDRKGRDYLYGRLLALAEHLESRALFVANESRDTNAGRLMQRFAERPYSTWLIIETGLTPYKSRLRAKRAGFLHNIEKEMDEVISSFTHDDFVSGRPLSGEFLLGYHCQRAALRPQVDRNGDQAEDSEV